MGFAHLLRVNRYIRHRIPRIFMSRFETISAFGQNSSISIRKLMEIEVMPKLSSEPQVFKCEGWIRTIRKQKKLSFVHIYDGSHNEDLQLVLSKSDMGEESYEKVVSNLSTGSPLQCEGTIQMRGKEGSNGKEEREMIVKGVELYSSNDPSSYPLQKKKHSISYLRTIPHLRQHTRVFSTIFQMRSRMAQFVYSYFQVPIDDLIFRVDIGYEQEEGFQLIHTPIITPLDCEGAGELFRVSQPEKYQDESPLFGNESYLTVSGQVFLNWFYHLIFHDIP